MASYLHVNVPAEGAKVTLSGDELQVPDNPIIPFIEGDGTGVDIWAASVRVLDGAVAKAYGGKKKIAWTEVYAGEKAQAVYGDDCPASLLPQETVDVIREYLVAIKGPLTTPVGEGFRSLNVTLRQVLDLYVCLRPVRYFKGVPSPVLRPHLIDMVIFRENTEDIYAGIEWETGTPEAEKVVKFLREEMGVKSIRFPRHRQHRHQTGLHRRLGTPDPGGHPLRRGAQPAQHHTGAQGQHPEVHRGRIHALGLRAGEAGVRRQSGVMGGVQRKTRSPG